MASGKRRSNGQLARDRRRISDLYLQGWLQVDIANDLSLNQSTISRDIKALQAEWQKSALIDFDTAKAREIAKIDNLEITYHDAWTRSNEDAETVTVKEYADGDIETTTTTKAQVGDPRFMEGVRWCIEKRCKIFNIGADSQQVHPSTIIPIAIREVVVQLPAPVIAQDNDIINHDDIDSAPRDGYTVSVDRQAVNQPDGR